LYIVNGKAGAGKDAFCKAVTELYNTSDPIRGVTRTIHSSDPAKQALKFLRWDGTKTPEARQLLATLVNFGQKNGASERLINSGYKHWRDIVFFQERNPKEIDHIKALWKSGDILDEACDTFKTILIKRDSGEIEEDIWGIENYSYDIVIKNCGTLKDLTKKAKKFMLKEDLYNGQTRQYSNCKDCK
ncbi:MAG: hypothetical protein RR490_10325, partial [Niameybacter sp.]